MMGMANANANANAFIPALEGPRLGMMLQVPPRHPPHHHLMLHVCTTATSLKERKQQPL